MARGEAADCLLPHVFPWGVEEDRNGQEHTEEEEEGKEEEAEEKEGERDNRFK